MVAIDHQIEERQGTGLAGFVRPFITDFIRPFAAIINLFRRQSAAERQRKRARIAERISAKAGSPSVARPDEPPRLAPSVMVARLEPWVRDTRAVTEHVTLDTAAVKTSLDRIDYELSAIRDDIAPYLPK